MKKILTLALMGLALSASAQTMDLFAGTEASLRHILRDKYNSNFTNLNDRLIVAEAGAAWKSADATMSNVLATADAELQANIDAVAAGGGPPNYPAVSNNAMNAVVDSDSGARITIDSTADMDFNSVNEMTFSTAGGPVFELIADRGIFFGPLLVVDDPLNGLYVGNLDYNDARYVTNSLADLGGGSGTTVLQRDGSWVANAGGGGNLSSNDVGSAAWLDQGTNGTDLVDNDRLAELAIALASDSYSEEYILVNKDGSAPRVLSTFAAADSATTAGDSFYFPEGYITTGAWTVKSDVNYYGKGRGIWHTATQEYDPAGGTVLVGKLESTTSTNYSLQHFAITGDPDTAETDVSFIGNSYGLEANAYINEVNFIGFKGAYTNNHNTQIMGGGYLVENCGSYNAGIHPFPLKTFNSTFRNIEIESTGASSGLLIKSDAAGVDLYGNTFENVTVLGDNGITFDSYSGRMISNTVFTGCLISRNGGSTAAVSVVPSGTGKVKDIVIQDSVIENAAYLVTMIGTGTSYDDKIDGVVLRNNTFRDAPFSAIYNGLTDGLNATNITVQANTFVNCNTELGGTTGDDFIWYDSVDTKTLDDTLTVTAADVADNKSRIDRLQMVGNEAYAYYQTVPGMNGFGGSVPAWTTTANSYFADYNLPLKAGNENITLISTWLSKTNTSDNTSITLSVGAYTEIGPPVQVSKGTIDIDLDFDAVGTNGVAGYTTIIVTNQIDLAAGIYNTVPAAGLPVNIRYKNDVIRAAATKLWLISLIYEQSE